jgi:hypothetical protein
MFTAVSAGRRVAPPPLVRAIRVSALLLILGFAPAAASAVTLDQIVALSKAGVSEPIILALIDRDKSVFAIEADQLAKLQKEGLSEKVLLAMLKSGRDEADAQVRADSALNAARILSSLSTEPDLVIVGHGPDVPNTGHTEGFWSGPPLGGFYGGFYGGPGAYDVLPVPVPYGGYGGYGVSGSRRRGAVRGHRGMQQVLPTMPPPIAPPASPALCIAQIATGPAPPMVASKGFVTVCPPALQPKAAR